MPSASTRGRQGSSVDASRRQVDGENTARVVGEVERALVRRKGQPLRGEQQRRVEQMLQACRPRPQAPDDRRAAIARIDVAVAGDRQVAEYVGRRCLGMTKRPVCLPAGQIESQQPAAPEVRRAIPIHLRHGRGGDPEHPSRRIHPHAERRPQSVSPGRPELAARPRCRPARSCGDERCRRRTRGGGSYAMPSVSRSFSGRVNATLLLITAVRLASMSRCTPA